MHRERTVVPETAAGFLSDEWFSRTEEALRTASCSVPGASARIQYQADGGPGSLRWHQLIEDGAVSAWRKGEIADADVEIHWERC